MPSKYSRCVKVAEQNSLIIAGEALPSRMLLGTSRYPSPAILGKAITAANPGFITVALRRAGTEGGDFYDLLASFAVRVVPNTAGCRTAKEACTTARMARELLDTNWIKLEVIADDASQAPDPFELVRAAEELLADDFIVLAYCTEDLALCQRLAGAGCHAVMPWGAPIGSGQGLSTPERLTLLRHHLPDTVLIVDAGLGRPSDAAQAMELGFDGVLLNTAVATAGDPASMAAAFAAATTAGRHAFCAGIMPRHDTAHPSTPTLEAPLLPPLKETNS